MALRPAWFRLARSFSLGSMIRGPYTFGLGLRDEHRTGGARDKEAQDKSKRQSLHVRSPFSSSLTISSGILFDFIHESLLRVQVFFCAVNSKSFFVKELLDSKNRIEILFPV